MQEKKTIAPVRVQERDIYKLLVMIIIFLHMEWSKKLLFLYIDNDKILELINDLNPLSG